MHRLRRIPYYVLLQYVPREGSHRRRPRATTGEIVSELKPCPFCGGIAEVHGYRLWMVSCRDIACRSKGPIRGSKNEAISAWNRRAPAREGEG
ncbi:Lar family restriction alleviation protein [Burkholderia sp. Bp9011]|uniref:Lar family restriction alleviation protein n=1 Tax=unclassified Burkholderia TaxID=2613784 RepID=UPI003908A80B